MGGAGKGRSGRERVGEAMQGRHEGCCGDVAVLYLTVSISMLVEIVYYRFARWYRCLKGTGALFIISYNCM